MTTTVEDEAVEGEIVDPETEGPGTEVEKVDPDAGMPGAPDDVKSDEAKKVLAELNRIQGDIELVKGESFSKTAAAKHEKLITSACEDFGESWLDFAAKGKEIVELVAEGLRRRAFVHHPSTKPVPKGKKPESTHMDPDEWVKSVVTFPKLHPASRKLLSQLLHSQGVGVRAIAEITGSSKSTAANDINEGKGKASKTGQSEEDEDEGTDEQTVDEAVMEAVTNVEEWIDNLEIAFSTEEFAEWGKEMHDEYYDRVVDAQVKLSDLLEKLDAAAGVESPSE